MSKEKALKYIEQAREELIGKVQYLYDNTHKFCASKFLQLALKELED